MDNRRARNRWPWREFLDDGEHLEMSQLEVRAGVLDMQLSELRARMNRLRNRGTQRARKVARKNTQKNLRKENLHEQT